MPALSKNPPQKARAKGRAIPKTVQFRQFKGVNLTDARTAIADDEFAWLENAITVGNGAIQITPAAGDPLVTIGAGIATVWGFVLGSTSVLITVNNDGSMTQVNASTGATTAMCVAGTVTTSARLTIWQSSTVLIVDPTKGYFSWTSAGVFAVIDATKTGIAVAVFEGRAWIASPNSRTITYTAPATFSDFTAGNGAGATIVTDEAFPGNIITTISALEQLWVVGQGGIEAIANVTATTSGGVTATTFSVTNIVTGLGSNSDASLTGYFRALTFMSQVGAYAVSGVTPQKLSDKLDGMFPALTLSHAPAAIGTVQNLLVLCFLVTYTQSLVPSLPTPASGSTAATQLLLCFTQGKWFFASQGSVTWITTLLNSGVSEAWGTDGSTLFKLFGGGTDDVTYKVQSKLYDFGAATTAKALMKFGVELQAAAPVNPTVTVDNEFTNQTSTINLQNAIQWTNNTGDVVGWTNNSAVELTWVAAGMVLARTTASLFGRYLGWTMTGTDAPYRIQAIEMEVALTREWSTP